MVFDVDLGTFRAKRLSTFFIYAEFYQQFFGMIETVSFFDNPRKLVAK